MGKDGATMAEPIRVAAVGLVHDHIWGTLDHLRADGRATLVAVCDDNAPLRDRAVREYGALNAYTSLTDLLERETIQAIVCGAENNRHPQVVEAAAARGVHVMVEKPMANSYEGARRMSDAATRGDVMLMVNWPTAWSRSVNLTQTLIQEGRIGKPFYVKYHAGHNGPREIGCSEYFWGWLYDEAKNGPGALMDYCCYGANLACHFLGQPHTVTGAGGKFVKDYDIPFDNAILLLQYAGAVGVAEASWTQIGHPPAYELTVMGTEGSIVAGSGEDHVILVTPHSPSGQRLEGPPLLTGRHHEAAYFLTCIQEGTPPAGMVSARTALLAQEALEAGARAIREERVVKLPLGS